MFSIDLGQTSIFGGAFFVSKSLLAIERQKKLKKKLQFWPECLDTMLEYCYIEPVYMATYVAHMIFPAYWLVLIYSRLWRKPGEQDPENKYF